MNCISPKQNSELEDKAMRKSKKKAAQKAKKLAAAGSESVGPRTVLSSASKHSVPLPQRQLGQQQSSTTAAGTSATQSTTAATPLQDKQSLQKWLA